MGFFEQVGRQVEQFKQTATETAEESAEYQCEECDSRFHTYHDKCPKCGAQTISSTTTED